MLAMALLAATGCTSLAERIAMPDPGVRSPSAKLLEMEAAFGIARRSASLDTGVRLAWLDIPAADRGFYADMAPSADGGLAFELGTRRGGENALPVATRGTVVYLHGWRGSATAMLPWALALSEQGYRGIAVDLRGHGASEDAPPGFGPREAGDIEALVDLLAEDGGIAPPLYVVGVSYGATAALFAEPVLRDRITGIVAMEPFANAALGIRGAIEGWMRSSRGGFRARLARTAMRWRMSPGDIERSIDEAGRLLDLDLRAIDAADVVRASQTCTLMIHGSDDRWLPPAATRELASLSPLAHHVEVDGTDHMTLPLRVDLLGGPIAAWLERIAEGECATFVMPQAPPSPAPATPSPAA